MKHLLGLLIALGLAATACGSTETTVSEPRAEPTPVLPAATPDSEPPATVPAATPTAPSPTFTPDVAALAEQEKLLIARTTWEAKRPDAYTFQYSLACECDQGPWRVKLSADGEADAVHLFDGFADAPYLSIDDVLDEIGATLRRGEQPVRVDYDPVLGLPLTYVFNEPELPVDGGFIFQLEDFSEGSSAIDPDERQALVDARQLWDARNSGNYDYSFARICFCPPEVVGPHVASVRGGEVVSATYEGTDLFELGTITIERYDDYVFPVDAVFDEIERALDEADALTATYDPVLGYPTEVSIDWIFNAADDEVSYIISDLVLRTSSPTCSTTGGAIAPLAQPDLPAAVADKRQAIFAAAANCDIDALVALTDPAGFTASFGGGEPASLWAQQEEEGYEPLLELVLHLNQPFTTLGDGADALYIWPSASQLLEAPYGSGLAPGDYERLLELYTVEELEEMFEFVGGYVGYRIGITESGAWVYFVAGD